MAMAWYYLQGDNYILMGKILDKEGKILKDSFVIDDLANSSVRKYREGIALQRLSGGEFNIIFSAHKKDGSNNIYTKSDKSIFMVKIGNDFSVGTINLIYSPVELVKNVVVGYLPYQSDKIILIESITVVFLIEYVGY